MSDKTNKLVKRRAELLEELAQVTRKIEDAQTEVFRHIASQKVLVQRYFDGDSIIVSFGRYWWINRDGGYFPKRNVKANADLIQKIETLPTVSVIEWADVFGADVFHQPGCFKSGETYFANGSNIEGEDFTEIKMSEWALAKEAMPV